MYTPITCGSSSLCTGNTGTYYSFAYIEIIRRRRRRCEFEIVLFAHQVHKVNHQAKGSRSVIAGAGSRACYR